MGKTFPLPQLLAGSKRATSAAVSDCAAHSRQLRSLSRLRLLRGVALHHASPCSLSVVSVGGRIRDWGIGDRNFILENSSKAAQMRMGAVGAPRNDLPKMSPRRGVARCVWQTRSSITIMDCRGKTSSPSHLIRPTVPACSFKAVRLHVSCTHLFGRITTRGLQ